jgi:hypothetical protein
LRRALSEFLNGFQKPPLDRGSSGGRFLPDHV